MTEGGGEEQERPSGGELSALLTEYQTSGHLASHWSMEYWVISSIFLGASIAGLPLSLQSPVCSKWCDHPVPQAPIIFISVIVIALLWAMTQLMRRDVWAGGIHFARMQEIEARIGWMRANTIVGVRDSDLENLTAFQAEVLSEISQGDRYGLTSHWQIGPIPIGGRVQGHKVALFAAWVLITAWLARLAYAFYEAIDSGPWL